MLKRSARRRRGAVSLVNIATAAKQARATYARRVGMLLSSYASEPEAAKHAVVVLERFHERLWAAYARLPGATVETWERSGPLLDLLKVRAAAASPEAWQALVDSHAGGPS